MNVTRIKTSRSILLVMSACAIAACSSPRPSAPIVDRTTKAETKPTPAVAPIVPRQMDSHGYYTVRKGDTLLQIALDFGQNYRDLVVWNNLANPNDIRVDQVLRVTPPPASTAVAQPNSVNAAPAVEVRPLATPATPATTATPAATAPVTNKTAPRGDKQPYSDATLAEMQKPEGAQPAPAAGKAAEVKPADKSAAEHPAGHSNAEDSSVSWMWPTDGKIVGSFDEGKKGIDISGKVGQPVVAAGAGKVMYAGSGIRGYGNLVIVKHTNNLLSAYAHNKTILVKEGQSVSKGEKIAEMGNSDSDAVKLHFEIRQQGKPVDPSKFLPNR